MNIKSFCIPVMVELSSVRLDIDECAEDIDQCHQLANCDNSIGSYICTCIDGYIGDGRNCKGKLCKSLHAACNLLDDNKETLPKINSIHLKDLFCRYLIVNKKVFCANKKILLCNQ